MWDKIKEVKNMDFDFILGNPPYQDGSKNGGQNKIYNQFSKNAIDVTSRYVSFITPISVCRKSKRFSIVGQSGLKYVDFTADDHFKVGIDVCHWTVDKRHTGDVTVECSDGSIHKVKSGKEIYDLSKIDKQILKVYEGVMNHTVSLNKSNNRMFIRNNHGPAFSDKKTEEHIYPTYSNNRGIEKITYTKRIPVFHGKKKIIISNTKALNAETLIVDTKDYGPSYFAYEVKNNKELDSIKSFVLTEYFLKLYKEFRNIRGGINSVLINYCPKFDTSKIWTNEKVKEFFESYVE